MVQPMTYSGAVLGTSHYRSFEMARNEAHEDLQRSAWVAALIEESTPIIPGMASAVNKVALVDYRNLHIESRHTKTKDVITREVKHAEKGLVMN